MDIQTLPSIKNNSFTLRCKEAVDGKTESACRYSVCQHTVLVFLKGKLRDDWSCKNAIANKRCKAVKMMIEERKANTPIYFIDAIAEIEAVRKSNATRLTPERKPITAISKKNAVEPASDTIKPITDVHSALVEAVTPN